MTDTATPELVQRRTSRCHRRDPDRRRASSSWATSFATAFSVLLLGWTVLIAGVAEIFTALFRIKSGGFFSAALGGAILTVLGLFILRNPLVGAVTLTLLAGSLFLASGITRILASAQFPHGRWVLVASGIVSVLLGLWVLFNLGSATLTLLGTLLGVQTLLEGLTLITVGRLRALVSP